MSKSSKHSHTPSPLKLNLPSQRGILIDRPRLLTTFSLAEWIAILSPAGSGKTTLVQQWAEAYPGAVCWVALSPQDDDPPAFWSYVLRLLGFIIPLSDIPALLLAQQGGNVNETFVDALLRDLRAFEHPLLLVLDDVQWIQHPALVQSLTSLAGALPSRMQVVMVGRSLAAALQAGALVLNDLAFTHEETVQILSVNPSQVPSPERIARIMQETEGWVMGIKLAALAISRGDPSLEQAANYSFHYLMDEVLRALPPDQREFIERTCACEVLSPELCDALIGRTDSLAYLETLVNVGMFVTLVREQPPTYRYHALFREVLLKQMQHDQPEVLRETHRRAAGWYASTGQYREAAYEANACGDLYLTARYALDASKQLITYSDSSAFRDWLAQFPPHVLEEQPRLRLFALMAAVLDRNRAAAQAHLDALLARPDAKEWTGEIEMAHAYLTWYFQPDSGATIPQLQEALKHLQRDTLYTHALELLSRLYEVQKQPAKALDTLQQAYCVAQEIGSPALRLHVASSLMYIHNLTGDLEALQQLAEDSMAAIAHDRAGLGQVVVDIERGIRRKWAGALLQRGEVESAAEVLKPALTHSGQIQPRLLWQLYTRQAEICAFQGDFAAMEQYFAYARLLQEGIEELHPHYEGVMGTLFEAQRARTLLRWERVDIAQSWLQRDPPANPEILFAYLVAHVPPHALIVVGDYARALEMIEVVVAGYARRNMHAAVAQTLALKALAYDCMGDSVAACAALDVVLAQTLPSGNVYPLALKGLFPFLQQCIIAYWEAGDDARADHLCRAIRLLQEKPPALPVDRFTPAEAGFIGMILEGYTNEQMMDETGTSLSNVRHRLQGLYAKMLTHNREKLQERLRVYALD